MASTNKTENYGLNQWVKSDPVLMDDMNADNRKIDAAMKGLADEIKAGLGEVKAEISMVRLGKYTAADGNVNASFDLSGINVSDYSEFKIWIGGMSETGINLYLRINNDSGANYISGQTKDQNCLSIIAGSNSSYYDAAKISLFCGEARIHVQMFDRHYSSVNGLVGYSTDYGAYMACGGSGLQSIQVYSNGAVGEQAQVVLYGILK